MNNTINTNNIISTDEAINIIETSVKNLIANPSDAESAPAILLRGAPGVGKSSIVKGVAKKLGIGFVDIRLAQMERVDLCGLPSTADGTTVWNVPEIWPRDPNSKGIIFFDEITAAPSDVQVSAYQIVLDRAISNSKYRLPDGWYIIAAGNRKEDKSVAKTMSAALANRFMHFDILPNTEDWCVWAAQNDIHPSITGYIRYRPQNLFRMDGQNVEQGWPSPRSWERVSSRIPLFSSNEEVLRKVVYGLIGPSVGTEFMEFHRIQKNFDDVLELLTNPKKEVVIPKENDRKYALASAVSYLVWNGKNEEDIKTRIEGMYRIAMKFTPDFATMMIKTTMIGNSKINRLQASSMIVSSPSYSEFAKKFGAHFGKTFNLK